MTSHHKFWGSPTNTLLQFWIPNDQGTCPIITLKTITILAKFMWTYKVMANDQSLDLKETSQYILFITIYRLQSQIEQNFRQSKILVFQNINLTCSRKTSLDVNSCILDSSFWSIRHYSTLDSFLVSHKWWSLECIRLLSDP